ncbi:1-deoxy-D-xylulose-5-phosphate synthase [Patescibacteria group bacterium]|nr:1-deoxy-D-xylulose-5-phosphate synthase [Patescibacteria group bacterium]
MKNIFVKKFTQLAKTNKNIFLLTGDLGFKLFDDFRKNCPKRFFNIGVAEANMISIAAGLSLSEKNVYCYSIAPFLIMRAFEQVRVDICFHNLNVKLLGGGTGLSYGLEGMTHHTIEDFAIMKALPNMTVIAPGDIKEAEEIAKQSINYPGPIYIRLPKQANESVYKTDPKIKIGKGEIVEYGKDICLITTGSMLYNSKIALEKLKKKKIKPTLVSIHTIKPLDENLIKKISKTHKYIFVIEEHSLIGGLGTSVAEILLESKYKGMFKKIALPDKYSCYIGHLPYLYDKYGLSPEKIYKNILHTIKNK